VPTVMVVPTEERKRVTTLFKQFCDVGSSKVPLALIPKVVKATLQPTHAPEGAYKRIQALAKEVLPAKCGASGAVALGEFITWYFDYAWPELTASEGAKPPDRKSRAGGGSRTTAADAAGSSRVATADGGKGGGASSAAGLTADAGCGESGAPACAPTAAASQSDQAPPAPLMQGQVLLDGGASGLAALSVHPLSKCNHWCPSAHLWRTALATSRDGVGDVGSL